MSGILFIAPNTSMNMQQDARTVHEMGLLGQYITPFGISADSSMMRAARTVDHIYNIGLTSELGRRAISELPAEKLAIYPWWEFPRTIYSRSGLDARGADNFYFFCLKKFARHAAKKTKQFTGIYAFDTAAVEAFQAAKEFGIPCIYGASSCDPRFYAELRNSEFQKFPGLRDQRTHIAATNAEQIARRESAWGLADTVIVNSGLVSDSHAAYGLDTKKAHVLPLAFPPPAKLNANVSQDGPLKLLWAGTFSVMKGAHYFLRALNLISGKLKLDIRIFGINELPPANLSVLNETVFMRPTIPRSRLFHEYRTADILVMPTLSDGFGLVISEAMSQGLPVITTSRAGASKFIQHGVNGLLIPPMDETALADALRWCHENRPALREMRQRASESAEAWQWNDYRRALSPILSKTLGLAVCK